MKQDKKCPCCGHKTTGKVKKKSAKPRLILVGINDIMEYMVQKIMNEYGVSAEDIKYTDNIDYISFEISGLDDTLCNEVLPPENDIREDGGCGSTGGGCICGKKKGHKRLHKCKMCGEEW